jgi:hypothetical protein
MANILMPDCLVVKQSLQAIENAPVEAMVTLMIREGANKSLI